MSDDIDRFSKELKQRIHNREEEGKDVMGKAFGAAIILAVSAFAICFAAAYGIFLGMRLGAG